MRKWLYVLLAISVLYAVSRLNSEKRKARYPILKRIDKTVTYLAWILLAAYGITFLYWIYTEIIR
jgi:hypothetical protein